MLWFLVPILNINFNGDVTATSGTLGCFEILFVRFISSLILILVSQKASVYGQNIGKNVPHMAVIKFPMTFLFLPESSEPGLYSAFSHFDLLNSDQNHPLDSS